ncbi:hypothetical protein GCM10027028_01600 [Streptomyces sundarbansensis]
MRIEVCLLLASRAFREADGDDPPALNRDDCPMPGTGPALSAGPGGPFAGTGNPEDGPSAAGRRNLRRAA